MKSAVVALVGRPSSGKSTLLNAICGSKVSIVSPMPQTTRNRIRGIYSSAEGQLVFLDTPGYHVSEKKLNKYLTDLVASALAEADLVLYVVDGSRGFGPEERAIIDTVGGCMKPVVIAFNKCDSADVSWKSRRELLSRSLSKAELLEISALTGRGVGEVVERLLAAAPAGEKLYPDEYYTDQPVDFRISEIVREKAINLTRQEVPHALYVRMEDLELKDGGRTLWARGFILVERDSQKGILVGAGGEKIKRIVREAEAELADLFPYAVRLDIRVKVDKDWRKKDSLLKKMIN
jgi:GTP-binding protein Era